MKRLGGIANKERWVGGESKGDAVTLTGPTFLSGPIWSSMQ
jgi:hypothetical protein